MHSIPSYFTFQRVILSLLLLPACVLITNPIFVVTVDSLRILSNPHLFETAYDCCCNLGWLYHFVACKLGFVHIKKEKKKRKEKSFVIWGATVESNMSSWKLVFNSFVKIQVLWVLENLYLILLWRFKF